MKAAAPKEKFETKSGIENLLLPVEVMMQMLSMSGADCRALRKSAFECSEAVRKLFRLLWPHRGSHVVRIAFGRALDVTVMMGKIARRISSPSYRDVIRLRMDGIALSACGLEDPPEEKLADFSLRLLRLLEELMTELDFLEPEELQSVFPDVPHNRLAECGERGDFYEPAEGMTAEEATAGSRAFAEERLAQRLGDGFADDMEYLRASFAQMAEEAGADTQPSADKRERAFRLVSELGRTTWFFHDVYAFLDGSGKPLDELDGIPDDATGPYPYTAQYLMSRFTVMQKDAAKEIGRYLDAALKLAGASVPR